MSASVAKTCGAVSVATSNTVILGANTSRRTLVISNDGSNIVYLAFSTSFGTAPTAVANSGARLAAAGSAGSSITLYGFSGAVSGIALVGATVVTVLEV